MKPHFPLYSTLKSGAPKFVYILYTNLYGREEYNNKFIFKVYMKVGSHSHDSAIKHWKCPWGGVLVLQWGITGGRQ